MQFEIAAAATAGGETIKNDQISTYDNSHSVNKIVVISHVVVEMLNFLWELVSEVTIIYAP